MRTIQNRIKDEVRRRYTAAVTAQQQGCCGAIKVTDRDLAGGCRAVAAVAGYRHDELHAIPSDAVANSFGCGNPLAFAEVRSGQVVVDIGSGAGIDCLLAAQKVGPNGRVIGIDMTPVMIEKARENALKAGVGNVEFRLGEAESMPVAAASADWIISNCVINLSPDKPRVFREAFRVLRPGGRLSITDIMVGKLPWILRQSVALYTSCVAGAISEAQYVRGLEEAGFSDIRVTEQIVYDRVQIMSLIREDTLVRRATHFSERSVLTLLDRYVVGKVRSAKVTARKVQGCT